MDRSVVDNAFWPSTHLLYDNSADTDPRPTLFLGRCVKLVCPRRYSRIRSPTHDEDLLKLYGVRWQIERPVSWLQRFRCPVAYSKRHVDLFHDFLQLACLLTTIQRS
ncbi:MAG: hypothetical protein KDA52_14205 [Planctomycetaceae bacterium]|nr:hypothetical protein [Planctomycetaceae bacterium]